MRAANDAVRFALELCLLAAVAYGGWSVADGVLSWLLAVAAPAAVAVAVAVHLAMTFALAQR